MRPGLFQALLRDRRLSRGHRHVGLGVAQTLLRVIGQLGLRGPARTACA